MRTSRFQSAVSICQFLLSWIRGWPCIWNSPSPQLSVSLFFGICHLLNSVCLSPHTPLLSLLVSVTISPSLLFLLCHSVLLSVFSFLHLFVSHTIYFPPSLSKQRRTRRTSVMWPGDSHLRVERKESNTQIVISFTVESAVQQRGTCLAGSRYTNFRVHNIVLTLYVSCFQESTKWLPQVSEVRKNERDWKTWRISMNKKDTRLPGIEPRNQATTPA